MKKIILLSFFIRLLIIFLSKNILNYDLLSYLKIGQSTGNIYPEIARLHHPYFPFFIYWERFFVFLTNFLSFTNQETIVLIKIFINLFDLGNIYLIYLLSKKNLKTMIFYAFNPISLLIFSFHGQFDSLPIFFTLLSIYLLNRNQEIFGLLSYSVAIMIKTWPVILLFYILDKLKDRKKICLIVFFPIISLLLYWLIYRVSILNILKPIIFYQGVWGIWGISLFINFLRFRYQKIIIFFFIIFIFYLSYRLNKKNYFLSITKFFLYFFIFTPGFSVQYFSWLIPFLTLSKTKNLLLVLIIFLSMIGYYYQIIFSSKNLFWFFLFFWLIFSSVSLKSILLKKD